MTQSYNARLTLWNLEGLVTALPNLVMYGWVDSCAGVSGNNGTGGYSNTFVVDGMAETLEHLPTAAEDLVLVEV